MSYTIETGISIPPIKRGGGGAPPKSNLRVALEEMKVSESVFVASDKKTANGLASFLVAVTKATGKKFTRRKVDGGQRVWRIA